LLQYEFVAISWAVMFSEQHAASLVTEVSKMSLYNLSKNYVIDCLNHLLPYVLHAEKFEWYEVLDIGSHEMLNKCFASYDRPQL